MSPAKIRKLPHSRMYRVYDPKGKIHAYRTTQKKAEAQLRILKQASHK